MCHYCGCRQMPLIRDYIAEHRELRIHISKEEDGIFPVTLVEFSGPEWDLAIAAWERAHPGRTLTFD